MAEKFGISTLLFEDNKLSGEHLSLIKEIGVQTIEILAADGHFDCEDSEQVSSIHNGMKKCSLRLHSLHSSLNLLDGKFGEGTSDRMKKEIDVLAGLGGRILVIHPCELANPHDPFGPDGRKLPTHLSWVRDILNRGEAAARIKDRFAALTRYGDKRGVRIAVENCDMHSLEFALFIAKSQAEIDFVSKESEIHTLNFVKQWMGFLEQDELSKVGICFDTGHANLLDAPGMLSIMGHRVITTHVHDNHGSGDEHLFPFQGSIDWEGLMRVFRKIDYRGSFVYEVGLSPSGVHLNDRHYRVTESGLNLSRLQSVWNGVCSEN